VIPSRRDKIVLIGRVPLSRIYIVFIYLSTPVNCPILVTGRRPINWLFTYVDSEYKDMRGVQPSNCRQDVSCEFDQMRIFPGISVQEWPERILEQINKYYGPL